MANSIWRSSWGVKQKNSNWPTKFKHSHYFKFLKVQMSRNDIWRSTPLSTAGWGLPPCCNTTVGSTSTSSPSSSSSGDCVYPPSSPEDDDDAFMGGNASAASDLLCAPHRKRAYVFATRRRLAKPLKERFFQSVTRGLIQSEERLAHEISDCCVCKKKCSIAFVEEPGLLSELLRCRNEFHSLRKHSDRRMYLRSLLTLTGLIHLRFLRLSNCFYVLQSLVAILCWASGVVSISFEGRC